MAPAHSALQACAGVDPAAILYPKFSATFCSTSKHTARQNIGINYVVYSERKCSVITIIRSSVVDVINTVVVDSDHAELFTAAVLSNVQAC